MSVLSDEFGPLLHRVTSLDPTALGRLRAAKGLAVLYVQTPFGVLAGRSVRSDAGFADVVGRAEEVASFLAGGGEPDRAVEWRSGLPPPTGWQRVETVPASETAAVVREGALEAGKLANATDELLSSTVITASNHGTTVEIALRLPATLHRFGFAPRDSVVHIDVAGRWVRLAGQYGSVYAERAGAQLSLAPRRL